MRLIAGHGFTGNGLLLSGHGLSVPAITTPSVETAFWIITPTAIQDWPDPPETPSFANGYTQIFEDA